MTWSPPFPCSHPGCPGAFTTAAMRDVHERQLHLICTCGRSFTRRALTAHVNGWARRIGRRTPHPPFPLSMAERLARYHEPASPATLKRA